LAAFDREMVLTIVRYPAQVLRVKCRAVTEVTERHRKLAVDMLETMKAAHGVGLAAPQVAVDEQMAVIDVSHDPECITFLRVDGEDKKLADFMPIVFLNPILEGGKEKEAGEEGCLSIPELRAKVTRPEAIKVTYQTLEGETVTVETDGLLARAFQHEIDHLNGVLFIDRVSAAAKVGVMRRLKWLTLEWAEDDAKAAEKAKRLQARAQA
jgi:peptide deformylase